MTDRFSTIEISDPSLTADGLTFATVRSSALGRRGDVLLFETNRARDRKSAPIIVLLHGVFGSHWAWAFKGAAHRTAQALVDAGHLPDCVLCMPSDGLWGDGSGYLQHDDADYERWIVEDAVDVARTVLAPCTPASPVFIGGLSMGGFGALRLAAKHPTLFRGAYGHSSVTSQADLREISADDATGWSDAAADRSVLDAISSCAGRMPPFGLDCGLDDSLLAANRSLHEVLMERGIPHRYGEYPGRHDWAYWREHLADSLRFFGSLLR